jgi:hypothetical protein
MSKTYVPKALRQRLIAESNGFCAYCHTSVRITGARYVIEHIKPEVAGGETVWENLCLACHSCNEFKGAAVEVFDPVANRFVPLFHPKQNKWRDHFSWSEDGSSLLGLTPTGRATVEALQVNHPDIVAARKRWVMVGWHPPDEDVDA